MEYTTQLEILDKKIKQRNRRPELKFEKFLKSFFQKQRNWNSFDMFSYPVKIIETILFPNQKTIKTCWFPIKDENNLFTIFFQKLITQIVMQSSIEIQSCKY